MQSLIKLSIIEPHDLAVLKEWRNSLEIRRWSRQRSLLSDYDQKRWYEKINSDPTIKMFSILTQKGSQLVGVCGLTSIDQENQRAEFSLYISPMHQRKGYAKSTLYALFNHGFFDLNLNLIWGESFDGNPAFKMFHNLGMMNEGIRREFYFKDGKFIDAYLFSITRSEWNKKCR